MVPPPGNALFRRNIWHRAREEPLQHIRERGRDRLAKFPEGGFPTGWTSERCQRSFTADHAGQFNEPHMVTFFRTTAALPKMTIRLRSRSSEEATSTCRPVRAPRPCRRSQYLRLIVDPAGWEL
jgi:hypothetical protein